MNEVLKDDPKETTQRVHVVLTQVDALEEDLTFCRVVQADKQLNERGLP